MSSPKSNSKNLASQLSPKISMSLTTLTEDRRKSELCGTLVVFALLLLRYLAYGFVYFSQLDDYIQLHNYANMAPFFDVIEELGMLAARPLAGLLDMTLWSWLFPSFVSIVILSALYMAAGLLIYSVFTKYFELSTMFFVLFALLPSGFEGLYWISASGRIIPSLFFAALSAYAYQAFLHKRRLSLLIFAAVSFFITCGFYEQGLVLGITMNVLVGLLELPKERARSLSSLYVIPMAVLMYTLMGTVENSPLYSGRTTLIFPWDELYFSDFLPNILQQLTAVLKSLVVIPIEGLRRFGGILTQEGHYIYLIIAIILCIILFIFATTKKEKRSSLLALIVGALLFIAPLSPFFVIDNPWFSIRGLTLSFVGLAIFFDSLLISLLPKKSTLYPALTAIIALLFTFASLSELHDYKLTTQYDTEVLTALQSEELEGKIGIIGVEKSALSEQNYSYHEHIHGITESTWALTGGYEYISGDWDSATISPISIESPFYANWNKEIMRLDNFDKLYYYDSGQITEVTIKNTGEYAYDIYLGGKVIFSAEEIDGHGYIKKVED